RKGREDPDLWSPYGVDLTLSLGGITGREKERKRNGGWMEEEAALLRVCYGEKRGSKLRVVS
ncbi:hypothetical protein PanWU01x14_026710, partial [Parasponia andersonii]